ncbi:MAG: RNA polymerase sigma factor [Myxococcota bacterium]
MPESDRDWAAVLGRLLAGDRLALAQVARLVSGFLVRWNAYDFRDEWDDLVQEVVSAAAIAVRDGKLREPRAAIGFLRSTARFKYVDRLRVHLRLEKEEALGWSAVVESSEDPVAEAVREDVKRALSRLPDKQQRALMAVYLDGRTYDEAARETGIPLGTLKRCLRDGLAQLRKELVEAHEER